MKRWKQITCTIIALLLVLFVAFPTIETSAATQTAGFTYSYPVDGVQFKLYKVGEINNNVYSLTGDFKDYQVLIYETDNDANKAAAETLASYAQRDNIQELSSATVTNGKLQFKDLTVAIYMLVGESAVKDDLTYTPEAILFSVPQKDENGDQCWDINATGKYSTTPVESETTSISAEKIWSDSGHESERQEEIVAQLLQDGSVYDEVALSDSNSWKYTWNDLESGHEYKVVERDTDANYTVKVENTDGTYVITNTYKITSKTTKHSSGSSGKKIPQTGQLWWPIGILMAGGAALILLGLIRRRRHEG